jgi:hypothetical protein
VGLVLGAVGVVLGFVVLGSGLTAGSTIDLTERATLLAWSFGVATTGFALLKIGIATILAGILTQLWRRVDATKQVLPSLAPTVAADGPVGVVETPYGRATVDARAPAPLLIHRMARAMWAPMLAMGAMGVLAGLVLSLVQADSVGGSELVRQLSALVPGLQFLGEALLLSGISFLLGTILFALRSGGGEVQESIGTRVTTLIKPTTAKVFVGLMALGLMISIGQFVGYAVTAGETDPVTFASRLAWLGPLREAGLGFLLAGIVMALATIARVLGFQFWRLRSIVLDAR